MTNDKIYKVIISILFMADQFENKTYEGKDAKAIMEVMDIYVENGKAKETLPYLEGSLTTERAFLIKNINNSNVMITTSEKKEGSLYSIFRKKTTYSCGITVPKGALEGVEKILIGGKK